MYLNYDWQTWPKCQFHTIFLELPDTLGVVEAEEQIVVKTPFYYKTFCTSAPMVNTIRYNCNVEMHKDQTKTWRVVDTIYPSGRDWGVRILYKLEACENYLGGWSLGFDLCCILG